MVEINIKNEPSEHVVEKAIMDNIVDNGYYVLKNQAGSKTGSGRPDLSACIKGRYWGIEVKANRSNVKTTQNQLDHLKTIAASGGKALYSKTSDIFNKYYDTSTLSAFSLKDVNQLLRDRDVVMVEIIDSVQLKIYKKGVRDFEL